MLVKDGRLVAWEVTGEGDEAVWTLVVEDISIVVRIGGEGRVYPWIAEECGVPWFERRWRSAAEARASVEQTVANAYAFREGRSKSRSVRVV